MAGTLCADAPGHDQSGRFVPFWHRYGGQIRLEANIDYDKPGADWYFAPTRRRAEVLIDPYEDRSRENPFSFPARRRRFFIEESAGLLGFDIHMDWLLEAADEPGLFESIEPFWAEAIPS